MLFNKSPFLRLTFPFILGIVSYHYLGDLMHVSWHMPVLLFLFFVLLARLDSRKYSRWLSAIALVMLFMFGFLRLESLRLDTAPNHLLWQQQTIEAYEAVVIEAPAQKQRSVNVRLDVKRVLVNEEWQSASGRVNAYAAKEAGDGLRYGDRLLIEGAPADTEPPSNPGEFDFANYLVYNNIFHQQYIGDRFKKVGEDSPNWFMATSIGLRAQCRELLVTHIHQPAVRSVMLAIVLGIKDELDNDLQAAFSASGAMHVLAVSGLHVGIIYAIIIFAFRRLKVDEYKWRWSIAVISVLILWCYAFLTGLSPSVLRAVTMFSFVALAKAMNRNGNIYNTLAASAFVLLWYNPYLIMSVGFQLSYLAVFGIVYLQPRFYRLLSFSHWLPDKIWAITCVSLAAQIATAPLSMLYFHQFPSYFLISNLFIIPAAFAMLLMGLCMLLFSPIPWVGEALGWLIERFVQLINGLVYTVHDLPGSTLEGIRITTGQTWLVYLVIILVMLLFYQKRFSYLLVGLVVTGVFATSQLVYRAGYLSSSTFRLLNVSNAVVADYRYGSESWLLADSVFKSDPSRRRFHFEPGRLEAGANLDPAEDQLPLARGEFFGNRLVCFRGETFLFVQHKFPIEKAEQVLAVDHLVLSNNAIRNLTELGEKLSFDQLLIDTSNKPYVAEKLLNQAKALDLNVHAIDKDGYFEKLWQE